MERLGSLGTAVPQTHFSKTVIEGSVPGRGKHAIASFHTCPSLDSSCFFPGTNVLIGRIEKAILKSCSVGIKLNGWKRIESWLHWTGNTVRGVPVCVVPCSWFPYSCPPGLSEWHRPSPRVLRESGQARNRFVWLFRCTRTSKLTALPTHFPGFKVRMTGSTAGPAIYQLWEHGRLTSFLWVSFFLRVNDYGYNSHQIGGLNGKKGSNSALLLANS